MKFIKYKKIMHKIGVIVIVLICSAFLFSCERLKDNTAAASQNPEHLGRGLEYTCRIENGDILVSTQEDIAHSPKQKKSSAFIHKKIYKPVDITDYDALKNTAALEGQLKYLEEVLIDKLVQETAAWKPDDAGSVKVSAEPQSYLPANERTIRLTKVKNHPKTTVYAKSVFSNLTGSENMAVGATLQLDTGIMGKIVSIDDDKVTVAFEPLPDAQLDGPFGKVDVKDKGDHFEIDIDARNGKLVSVGPAVGRIAEVGKNNFLVDYAHPFGGETLQCDVRIVAIERDLPSQGMDEQVAMNQHKQPVSADASDFGKNTQVGTGDLVEVAYTARLKSNGRIIQTTSADIAKDSTQAKVLGYNAPETFGPITVVAGESGALPGLGYAVMGLAKGAQKAVVVPASKAFGGRNPGFIRKFDRVKTVPTTITMSAKAYSQKYNGFPVKKKTISYNPYVNAVVKDVTEDSVTLRLSPVTGEIDSDFGLTRMKVENDKINIYLTPRIGGYFELEKRPGRVVAVSDNQFTVDFNDPLAGQDILFDVKVLNLTKASEFSNMAIHWIEDYEKGMQTIKAEKKPAVMLLYAEWCSYCKKLQQETLTDPRIKMMQDDYVWIKVNSDKQLEIKDLYGQKGFPMTVLLDKNGEVVEKISGFRPAGLYETEIKTAFKKNSAIELTKALEKAASEMQAEKKIQ